VHACRRGLATAGAANANAVATTTTTAKAAAAAAAPMQGQQAMELLLRPPSCAPVQCLALAVPLLALALVVPLRNPVHHRHLRRRRLRRQHRRRHRRRLRLQPRSLIRWQQMQRGRPLTWRTA